MILSGDPDEVYRTDEEEALHLVTLSFAKGDIDVEVLEEQVEMILKGCDP